MNDDDRFLVGVVEFCLLIAVAGFLVYIISQGV